MIFRTKEIFRLDDVAKYYIQSGSSTMVLQKDHAVQAAVSAFNYWRKCKQKTNDYIRVSEIGFDFEGENPLHANDSVFTYKYIKALSR